MGPEFNTPFDMYRTNLDIALRMLASAQGWRQHASMVEKLRIERDADVMRRMRGSAATATDWSEFLGSFQAVLRDYLATTSNIWQQCMGLAVRNRDAIGEGMRDALNSWQPAWADQWKKAADMSGCSAPVYEWLQHHDSAQAAPQAVGSQADAAQAVGAAAAGARTRLVRGE
jgi:hypothetical protein